MNTSYSTRLIVSLALAAIPSLLFAQETSEVVGEGIGVALAIAIVVVVGAAAGWVASKAVKGSGSGFWMDVLIGIGGAALANVAMSATGITWGSGALGKFSIHALEQTHRLPVGSALA